MNYAEQLKAERDLAIVKFADEFSETIKPFLAEAAKEGYSGRDYMINQKIESEKEKLHLYTSPTFVDRLNKKLDGVLVEYGEEFVGNFLNIGRNEHFLYFSWD